MAKHCANCGNEMPEEASFCLNCFKSVTDKSKINSVVEEKKTESFRQALLSFHRILTTKKAKATLATVALLLVFFVGVSAMASRLTNNKDPQYQAITPETTLVPVTQADGTAVTDIDGNNIFEVVEVTTKKSFWDKVFGTTDENTSEHSDTFPINGKNDNVPDSFSDSTGSEDKNTTSATTGSTAPVVIASDDDFTYSVINDTIQIKKYNGNASCVVVPSTIAGKPVAYIAPGAFSDNSTVKSISFTQSSANGQSLYLSQSSFKNLSNLTSITLASNTSSYIVSADAVKTNDYYSALYCAFSNLPSLESVNVSDGGQLFSVDGVLCGPAVAGGSSACGVLYYPQSRNQSEYNIPSKVTYLDSHAFHDSQYLEKMTVHKSVKNIISNDFSSCKALKHFEVESGNTAGYYSVNGVICGNLSYKINGETYKTIVAYPPQKTDSYFEITDFGTHFAVAGGFSANPYLKTLKLPSAKLYGDIFTDSTGPKNLNKIMLPAGDALTADSEYIIRSYSSGRCTYEEY